MTFQLRRGGQKIIGYSALQKKSNTRSKISKNSLMKSNARNVRKDRKAKKGSIRNKQDN